MKAYIRSASAISAQHTFGDQPFLTNIVEYTGNWLKPIEPDYKAYIDPKLIRRMSHVIKMGLATALDCLQQAKLDQPDAIITGTAMGIMEDTVSFLTRIVEMQEEMLSPTAFIQSTHNTVAAQIALSLKCHNYNNTFVHKGVSFENAVLDALMLINEGEARDVLVGGIDEMVDVSYKVLTRLGLYKRKEISNLYLFKEKSKGTIGSEGASFFVLSDKPGDVLAELTALKTFFDQDTTLDPAPAITKFLAENGLTIDDIDLVITGKNGDINNDAPYDKLKVGLFQNTECVNYKHLSGEYPTSSGFALWVAANIIGKQIVPTVLLEDQRKIPAPKKVLIYNRYQNRYHSLMLVSAC
ncbi:beta-ketoacyl synthase chain length factor [Mucilaginibacter myungsuensis]|uniref:Beta-ketoacyl synthase chain length factor n=1 Tax=Mucilaginibacter myungsuensis TaxID=649104 RepID=A0A929L141_9SPHI|nr:beta-ketoacyl synthase chain length factor [Mucilaginibacter myungsuensis]MBE9661336.1 beta-ketoacyl synthase chain length factor [Mucilaginibacter myungsuensis]MDN3597479.1 beta-ketoacyl synthase chain length factor [Mucilaginibacter myungsuensis]